MKRLLLIIISAAAIASCGSIDETEYEYTIGYSVGGSEYSYTGSIELPRQYTPTYICGMDYNYSGYRITVFGGGSGYSYGPQNVYSGKMPCHVESFDYKAVRNFKVSRISGKEYRREL